MLGEGLRMPDKTTIEWTDATWNPIRGCSRVSEGCRNCYAEKIAARFSGEGKPFEGLATMKNGEARWTGEIAVSESTMNDPLHWRTPRRIFVNSMSDLFHERVLSETRVRIFALMMACPQHTFQILTKRPGTMATWVEWFYGHRALGATVLPNVWLGVSVEDQATADARIPLLLKTPAAVRFISVEPLIADMKLRWEWVSGGKPPMVNLREPWAVPQPQPKLDWVIVGGESGPDARPMHPLWARTLRDQCEASCVPFFFKQWGEWAPLGQFHPLADATFAKRLVLNGYTFLKAGKKKSGRMLDGREWNGFPTMESV